MWTVGDPPGTSVWVVAHSAGMNLRPSGRLGSGLHNFLVIGRWSEHGAWWRRANKQRARPCPCSELFRQPKREHDTGVVVVREALRIQTRKAQWVAGDRQEAEPERSEAPALTTSSILHPSLMVTAPDIYIHPTPCILHSHQLQMRVMKLSPPASSSKQVRSNLVYPRRLRLLGLLHGTIRLVSRSMPCMKRAVRSPSLPSLLLASSWITKRHKSNVLFFSLLQIRSPHPSTRRQTTACLRVPLCLTI
jgi:hypothetical protein